MVKFVRRDFTAWSNIRDDVNDRCLDLIHALGEMITGSGTGWKFDDRTPADTYIFIPSEAQTSGAPTYQFPVSYFVNELSGAKMMVMVNANAKSTESNYPTSGKSTTLQPYISNKNYLNSNYAVTNSYFTSSGYAIGNLGVNISMIPAGSDSEFPNTIINDRVTQFIPSDAIPLVTESYSFTNSGLSSNVSNFSSISSGNTLSYGILIDSEFVMILSSRSTTATRAPLVPLYALGKIIGNVAHEEDDSVCSHYGAIRFRTSGIASESNQIRETSTINGSNMYLCGQSLSDTKSSNSSMVSYPAATFFDVTGNLITSLGNYFPTNEGFLSNAITDTTLSSSVRWCPVGLAVMYEPGTQGYYVVPGDGFKGYLDTNLFRYATCTKGNYFNNGTFVGLENNFLVAWDPDATDNIM